MNRSGIRWLLFIIGVVAAGAAVCLIVQLILGGEEPEPTPTPTNQVVVQATPITTPTPTATPTPTVTPTSTPIPTATSTPTPTATPLPPPIPAPPGATIGFCYRVQLGETVYSLAQKFEVSPYAINLANDLFPPNLVVVHQALFIPEELGHGPNVYIFRQGDTLLSIAEKCRLPASMIARVNGLDSGVTLKEGDAIIIPIPPFPPPARFNYPTGLLPIVPYPPPCCDARLPYRPGPPLNK